MLLRNPHIAEWLDSKAAELSSLQMVVTINHLKNSLPLCSGRSDAYKARNWLWGYLNGHCNHIDKQNSTWMTTHAPLTQKHSLLKNAKQSSRMKLQRIRDPPTKRKRERMQKQNLEIPSRKHYKIGKKKKKKMGKCKCRSKI